MILNFFNLLIISYLNFYAQQPSHVIWGQKELSSMDIYDLLQGRDGSYWIATNEGLLSYDGRDFQSYELEGVTSESVFNLLEDKSGAIFCNNLSGQVFKVEGSVASLYYQLPDSLMSPFIFMEIDDQDCLIFLAKDFFRINKERNLEIIQRLKNRHYDDMLRRSNGALTFYSGQMGKLCSWKNGELSLMPINRPKGSSVGSLVEVRGKLYAFDHSKQGQLYFFKITDEGKVEIRESHAAESSRVKHVYNDKIWRLHETMGLTVMDTSGSLDYEGKTLFGSELISAFLKDGEGNVLLGTFGSGIFFIPTGAIENYQEFPSEERIRSLAAASQGEVYAGTVSGKLYKITGDGGVEQLLEEQGKGIEEMEWVPSLNSLWLSHSKLMSFHEEDQKTNTYYSIGAIKDIHVVSEKVLLIASSFGVYRFGYDESLPNVMKTPPFRVNEKVYYIPSLSQRSNAVVYDPEHQGIYVGTSNGLMYMDSTGNVQEIHFEHSAIAAQTLFYWAGNVYAGTLKKGILILKDGETEDHWGDLTSVYKIASYQDHLVVSTDEGLLIRSTDGQDLYKWDISDGLKSNRVADFSVDGTSIWLAHHGSLQRILIDSASYKEQAPTIDISAFLVNGQTMDLSTDKLSYDQSRITYIVSSQSKRNKEETLYYYQLEGVDAEWKKVRYYDNKITYKSLAPGDYQFRVKSAYRNKESQQKIHSFQISPPYYNQGWFRLVVVFTIFLLLGIAYRSQLNKQRKKAAYENELMEVKLENLRAQTELEQRFLRSQLNPHFIFNALSAIQNYMLKNNAEAAATYLAKFSKLMREILENSRHDYIPVGEEIAMIRNYLDIHKLRMNDAFDYSIEMDDQIDPELHTIPPMFLQPFVENSIEHGIAHLDHQGQIFIVFYKQDEYITIDIKDNGKGISAPNKRFKNHHSLAHTIIKERIDLLNRSLNKKIHLKIENITDDQGTISGVRVEIKVPFNYF